LRGCKLRTGSYTIETEKGLEPDLDTFYSQAPGDILRKLELASDIYYHDLAEWKRISAEQARTCRFLTKIDRIRMVGEDTELSLSVKGRKWWNSDGKVNMPDGESLARQLLYGKRYFLEKFGVDVTVGWNPDSFGHNFQLPQILRKGGVRGLVISAGAVDATFSQQYKVHDTRGTLCEMSPCWE
jgi:hypothetical protein